MKKTIYIMFLLFAVMLSGCNKNKNKDYPLPQVPVYIQFNIDNPAYFKLQPLGGYMYMEGGVNGLVLIHNYDNQIYAMDRACPYNFQDSCAKINMKSGALFMGCGHYDAYDKTKWIPCCGSEYDLTGGVVTGPAVYPMKAYRVQMSGRLVTISD